MKFNLVRPFIVLLGIALSAGMVAAQSTESHSNAALRSYYSNLSRALLRYDFGDVPFEHRQVVVTRKESLLEIARQHRFRELDFYHLAAALYEANPMAFDKNGAGRLKIGTTIKLPTVAEIFDAQYRYETLKVVGDDVDFQHDENQMRKALRWPFGKSPVMIGPDARDELPGNQEVTLTSYRPGAISVKENSAVAGFLSQASSPQTAGVSGKAVAQDAGAETYGRWLNQSEKARLIAGRLQSQETGGQKEAMLSTRFEEKVNVEALVISETVPAVQPQIAAVSEAELVGEMEMLAVAAARQIAEADDAAKVSRVEPVVELVTSAVSEAEPAQALEQSVVAAEAEAELKLPVVTEAEPVPISEALASSSSNSKRLSVPVDQIPHDNAEPEKDNVLAVVASVEPAADSDIGDKLYPGSPSGDPAPDTLSAISEGRSVKQIAGIDGIDGKKERNAIAAITSETHADFLQRAGISSLLKQFPVDIQNSANRHARRCGSSATVGISDADQIYSVVIDSTRQTTPEAIAQNLVEWYDSPVGVKVQELERGEIDEDELKQFSANASRVDRIEEIYNDTVTGKGIASLAIELDYSGWLLSGCIQKADRSGDAQRLQEEMLYGQGIRNKQAKLESILREEMVLSMAYLFTPLSDRELTEYAEIVKAHAAVHSELQQSIINAIELEVEELTTSSLR